MSHVTKPIGLTRHTSELILMYLTAVDRPARTSEVRQAVVAVCPESASPIYGCLGDLQTAGRVKRLTMERDALLTTGSKTSVRKGGGFRASSLH